MWHSCATMKPTNFLQQFICILSMYNPFTQCETGKYLCSHLKPNCLQKPPMCEASVFDKLAAFFFHFACIFCENTQPKRARRSSFRPTLTLFKDSAVMTSTQRAASGARRAIRWSAVVCDSVRKKVFGRDMTSYVRVRKREVVCDMMKTCHRSTLLMRMLERENGYVLTCGLPAFAVRLRAQICFKCCW